MAACFGIGTTVDFFRQVGTVHFNSERFNISVNTSPSSAGQSLRTRPGMPSGPVASVESLSPQQAEWQRQMSRNEASAGRDAKSSASRRSVSFPHGTRVTYVTWGFPLQKIELRPKTLGERDTHTARLPKSLPAQCVSLWSTPRARGQKSLEWPACQGHKIWQRSGA